MADENLDLNFLGEQMKRLQGDVRQLKADVSQVRGDQLRLEGDLNRLDRKLDALIERTDDRFDQVDERLLQILRVMGQQFAELRAEFRASKAINTGFKCLTISSSSEPALAAMCAPSGRRSSA
jgi:hypothetical protein